MPADRWSPSGSPWGTWPRCTPRRGIGRSSTSAGSWSASLCKRPRSPRGWTPPGTSACAPAHLREERRPGGSPDAGPTVLAGSPTPFGDRAVREAVRLEPRVGGEAVNHGRLDMTEPQRTPAAYWRDCCCPPGRRATGRPGHGGRRALPRRGPGPGHSGPRCAVGRPGPGRQSLLACGRNIGKATSPGQKLLRLLYRTKPTGPNHHCGKISPRKACR